MVVLNFKRYYDNLLFVLLNGSTFVEGIRTKFIDSFARYFFR